MDNPANGELENGWRSIYAMWIIMLIATFVYLIAGLYLENLLSISLDENTIKLLRYSIYLMSLLTVLSIRFVRNYVFGNKTVIEKYLSVSENNAVNRYTAVTISTLTLAETIAIFGVILYMISGYQFDLYLLILLSASAMIYYRPFREELYRLSDKNGIIVT